MNGFEQVMIGLIVGSIVTIKLCAVITGDLKMLRRKPRKVRISGQPKDCSFEERYPVKRGW